LGDFGYDDEFEVKAFLEFGSSERYSKIDQKSLMDLSYGIERILHPKSLSKFKDSKVSRATRAVTG